jgi:RNA polymerase sigma-70 factor, ECF subfamily
MPGSAAEIDALLERRDYDGAARLALRSLGPRILDYQRSLVHDEADAREAFSLFCEKLWRSLPEFRRECSCRTFAYRLAWHAAVQVRDDEFRRRTRRLVTGEASRLAEEIGQGSPRRDEQRRRQLLQLRAELQPEERSLLALRVDQELGWEEIAQVMDQKGVGAAALRKRYERLKERLARRAEALGLMS